MEYKRSSNQIALRLEKGEEVIASLKELCEKEKLQGASISGIGATKEATVGVYNLETKEYKTIRYSSAMEITALNGSISRMNGEPYLHLHITLGDTNGNAFGGHLTECVISATAEIFLTVMDFPISRERDEAVGLNLMHF